MHPRLVGAKKLADSGAIERVGEGEHGTGEYSVRSGENTYTVVLPADPYAVEGYLCSCPWWLKYRGTRVLQARAGGQYSLPRTRR